MERTSKSVSTLRTQVKQTSQLHQAVCAHILDILILDRIPLFQALNYCQQEIQGMPVFCTTHYQSNSEINSSYWKLKGGSLVKQVHLLLCT